MNIGTIWKLPAEVLTRVVDFSQELATGEILTSIVSVIATDASGNNVSASIIGPSAPAIVPPTGPSANTQVQFQIQNGTLNAIYTITVTVSSSASNTYQAVLSLMIGSGIALTTLKNVRDWIGATGTGNDQAIQDLISSFSLWTLHQTGRGTSDGTVPTSSPFLVPMSYDEVYDGNGNDELFLINWPITSVSSVTIDGIAVQQSTGVNVPGWVIGSSAKYLAIRGSPSLYRRYRYGGIQDWNLGTQNVEIVYTAGFAAVPFDLEFMARKVIGRTFKGKAWIGQKSQAMAQGAGTISFNDWLMDDQDVKVMRHYQARAA